MDEFSRNYDIVIFLGDFNTCIDDNAMKSFCSLNNLTSLIDQPTCYKNPWKPTYMDLILNNRPNYFQENNVFEIGFSDFHKVIVKELKIGFQKLKHHIVAYRDYKHFDNERFWSDIESYASEKIWNALKKLFSAYLTSMFLLKDGMSVPMRLPSWQKSYVKLSWEHPGLGIHF